MRRGVLLVLAAALATPAVAQTGTPVIAVPPIATPDGTPDKVRSIAWQATQLIASDLQTVSDVMALPPDQKDFYAYPEVTAPTFSRWRAKGARVLLTGFVQARSDGRLTIGC
jgi:TolB protein